MPVILTSVCAATKNLKAADNAVPAILTHGSLPALTIFATADRFHVCTAVMPACAAASAASDLQQQGHDD